MAEPDPKFELYRLGRDARVPFLVFVFFIPKSFLASVFCGKITTNDTSHNKELRGGIGGMSHVSHGMRVKVMNPSQGHLQLCEYLNLESPVSSD